MNPLTRIHQASSNIAVYGAVNPPALVQQKVMTTADGRNIETIFDTATLAGNTVIACISSEPDSILTTPDFDSTGMTQAVTISLAGKVDVYIYFIHNVASGVTTMVGGLANPVRASVHLSEWSGLANAAAQDTSTNTAASSSALEVVPATLDATTDRNLVIGIGGYENATDTYSSGPTNSFTRLTQTGGNSVFQECAYLIRSNDHAAVTSTVTLSSALAWAGCAAAFGGN